MSRLAGPGLLVMLPKTKMERLLSLPAVLVTLLHLCMGDLHYKHYRWFYFYCNYYGLMPTDDRVIILQQTEKEGLIIVNS